MKMTYLLLIVTLLPAMAHASNCTEQRKQQFEHRLATGQKNVAQLFLSQAPSQEVARAFADIAVAEQNLVIWGCYNESDPRLVLRTIRIHNQMDVYPAAFQSINNSLNKEFGINLLDPEQMFNTTIYLTSRGGRHE